LYEKLLESKKYCNGILLFETQCIIKYNNYYKAFLQKVPLSTAKYLSMQTDINTQARASGLTITATSIDEIM